MGDQVGHTMASNGDQAEPVLLAKRVTLKDDLSDGPARSCTYSLTGFVSSPKLGTLGQRHCSAIRCSIFGPLNGSDPNTEWLQS